MSKAIYVQYDIPEELAQKGPGFYHDAFIASDRSIWLGAINSGMMVHLKPNALNPAERYKVYTTASDDAGPHGIAEDRRGHIYYAGLHSGTLGEIDTETGKVTEHQAPFMSGATLHSLWTDSEGNIWFSEIHGGDIGKYDPKTGHLSSFTPPTPDLGPYGMIEDLKGNIWTATLSKNIILKLDPRTSVMTEYKTPTLGSGPRRIRMDSKGKLWFSESGAEGFGSIDPETGVITEYKLPVPNISPYSMWLDRKDESILWGSDFWNAYSPFQYNLKTKEDDVLSRTSSVPTFCLSAPVSY